MSDCIRKINSSNPIRDGASVVHVSRYGNIQRLNGMACTDVNKTYDKMNNRLDDPDYYMGDYVNLLLDYNPIALYAADRGLYKSVATQLTAASSQYWTSSTNSGATNKFTVSLWVKPASLPLQVFVSETDGSLSKGYRFQSYGASAKVSLQFADGTNLAYTGDVLTIGTWVHLACVFDGTQTGNANRLKIYINGVSVSLTFTGTIPSEIVSIAGLATYIGAIPGLTPYSADGSIDSCLITPVALSNSDITSLYNSGAGVVYADLSTAQRTTIGTSAAWYDFDGDGLDSHGSNHLTAVNSPTYVAGKPNKVASANGDTIAVWQDQSGNGHHMSQTILSKRPTLSLTGGPHNTPCIVSDGSDDYMITTTQLTTFPNKRGAIIGIITSPSGGSYPAVCSIYPSSTGNWLAYGDDTSGAPKALFYDGIVRVAALQDGTSAILKTWHRNTDISMLHRRNHVLADTLTLSDNQAPVGVMSMYSAMGANIWGGKISVLALFPNLTTSQICDIEAILNKKFRIY